MPSGLRMSDVLTLDHIEQHFEESDWLPILQRIFRWRHMRNLRDILQHEEDCGYTILPSARFVFEALRRTRLEDVKVVILGQEPYPIQGQADGMAFSMQDACAPNRSRSLNNIIREVNEDWAPEGSCRHQRRLPDGHVCLRPWADQGVLLLNTVLTFRRNNDEDQPDGDHLLNSHIEGDVGKIWKYFTTKIIKTINHELEHVVFVLWGKYAREKIIHIDRSRHKILPDYPRI